MSKEYKQYARTCTVCNEGMNEGYCIENGAYYYCSDECMEKDGMTKEDFSRLYDNGDGDSYWTEWEVEEEEDLDYHCPHCKRQMKEVIKRSELKQTIEIGTNIVQYEYYSTENYSCPHCGTELKNWEENC